MSKFKYSLQYLLLPQILPMLADLPWHNEQTQGLGATKIDRISFFQ